MRGTPRRRCIESSGRSCSRRLRRARQRHGEVLTRTDRVSLQRALGCMADEVKNYITPGGFRRLQDELARLWKVERPPIVTTVTWAAGNGDRSENGDYIYGKRKLREIDRRIRYLSKSLDRAVVVDNSGKTHQRVHFGATVTILYETGDERQVTIVGVDELDSGDRTRVLALSAGQGAADGKGRRHGDASRAAWTRAPRDHRGRYEDLS